MSTLTVATINTADAFTDLTFGTGNTSAGKIIIPASGSAMYFQGGFLVNSYNIGVTTTGVTITPDPKNGNYQYLNANSTWTLAVPPNDCAIDILITNGLSVSTLTVSASYTAPSGGGGDPYTTTANFRYLLMIRRINGISTYLWKALQ